MPKWLQDAPLLPAQLNEFYSAFCELSTCRPLGFGAGPIPWSVIMEWCDRESLHGPDRSDFLYLIRALDGAFLEHSEQQRQAAIKPRDRPPGGKIGGHS